MLFPLRTFHPRRCVLLAIAAAALTANLHADEVTDWNQVMLQAAHTAGNGSTTASRSAAIVEVSVFDAVNGINCLYEPLHVTGRAPRDASAPAAAIQAAYVSLVSLYPTQVSTFDAARTTSLNALQNTSGSWWEQQMRLRSINEGVAWGQEVASQILAWRSTDGFTPAPAPFIGGTSVGEWRPTPPAFAPGVAPQFAYMTPWVIQYPSQFRPAGPPALTSARYTQDFNETELMGRLTSTVRTADETAYAQFWNGATPIYEWNSVALYLGSQRHMSLLKNARLFAELNVAIADATIAMWDAKYHYVAWRPITAVTLADTDGNLLTAPDPAWVPLITTPAHPEYPSAHSGQSSAAATVLAHFFGSSSSFIVASDGQPGVVRSFSSFSSALDEVANARVFGGIHFRFSTQDAQASGTAVGKYVVENAFQRQDRRDYDDDDIDE
jgi:PAP2 superfamily